jgi:hypothetical protein
MSAKWAGQWDGRRTHPAHRSAHRASYGPGPHTLANGGLTVRRVVARRLDATGYATTAAVAALLT